MALPAKHALARFWRPFRVAGKTSELSGAGAFLSQPRWAWLAFAVVAEAGSYASMACLQRSLLRAGGAHCRLSRVSLITLASNSIQSALPVGAAFAALFQFGQYQLLGADEVLAGWVVIATAIVLFATLAALAGLGLALAVSAASAADLVETIIGVIIGTTGALYTGLSCGRP
jgi:uncharacterized membrane protein YbhN (UPF0104 family)